jgi:hypothetical protein
MATFQEQFPVFIVTFSICSGSILIRIQHGPSDADSDPSIEITVPDPDPYGFVKEFLLFLFKIEKVLFVSIKHASIQMLIKSRY